MTDFFKKIFSSGEQVKDPVCGMTVDPQKAQYHSVYKDKHYYFCSANCQKQFEENPEQFAR